MSRVTHIVTAPDNNSSDNEDSFNAEGEAGSIGFYDNYHFPSFGTMTDRRSADATIDDGRVESNPTMGGEEQLGAAAVQVDTNRLERYLQSIKERLKYHEELIHDLSQEWKEGSKDNIQKTAGIVRKVDYCSMEVNSLRDYILSDQGHQKSSSKGSSSYGSSSNSNTASLSILRSGTEYQLLALHSSMIITALHAITYHSPTHLLHSLTHPPTALIHLLLLLLLQTSRAYEWWSAASSCIIARRGTPSPT